MDSSAIDCRPGADDALPDYGDIDLGDLMATVTHPALSSVLGGLAGRSLRPQDAAAYFESDPDPPGGRG